jgi:hypothetical protein
MKNIPLTHGKFAIVDDEDFIRFGSFSWCAANPQGNTFYAVRNRRQSELDNDPSIRGERGQRLYLMRDIAGVAPHIKVKPINGNTLDCRRANIRVAQPSSRAAMRRAAEKYIQPCFPTGDEADVAHHPYRGLYKDFRNATKEGGGVLVKSYKAGAVAFFGPYRTAAQAMSRRDALEKERADLGQPPINYSVAPSKAASFADGFPSIVASAANSLLEELL